MPKGLAEDTLYAIALYSLCNVLFRNDQAEPRMLNCTGYRQYQNILAGDLVVGIFEYGLVICGTQQTQLLAKAKVRHRFYFRECCRLKGKPITL